MKKIVVTTMSMAMRQHWEANSSSPSGTSMPERYGEDSHRQRGNNGRLIALIERIVVRTMSMAKRTHRLLVLSCL